MNLFAYGTLQVPAVMERVAGGPVAAPEPAVLTGYRRFLLRDKTYPGIVETAEATVAGMLFRDLTAEVVRRLDAFEDPIYERLPVRVTLGAETVDAFAYVVPVARRGLLDTVEWSLERFRERDLTRFLETHGGWTG